MIMGASTADNTGLAVLQSPETLPEIEIEMEKLNGTPATQNYWRVCQ